MKKRILSLLLAFLTALTLFPVSPTYAEAAQENGAAVTVRQLDTEEYTGTVTLNRDGEVFLRAETSEDAAEVQWQIEAAQDMWVNIAGGTEAELRVSYALVGSLLQDNCVRLRCAAGEEVFSEPVTVVVTEYGDAPDTGMLPMQSTQESKNDAAPELFAGDGPINEDVTIYTVTIEYVYADGYKLAGQRVALPYVYEATEGEIVDEIVVSPNCVGYAPDMASVDLSAQGAVTGNVSIRVEYAPAQVAYTVRHYLQNVEDDEYTWVDTTLETGYTEDMTSDAAAKDYDGFTALSHYHEEIAADSSTTIDIYYDRNYYLIAFELGGGYGVEPIYARYGAALSVNDPQRTGWTFDGWDQPIPSTIPAGNRTFTAKWAAKGNVPFTIAYWLEDPNAPGKYNYWASVQQKGTSGESINGETYKNYADFLDESKLDVYERRYSEYSHADSGIAVKGDGSTVVNVYYDRKEYTLKFYYAQSANGKYYVIGGSTYAFGASASISQKGDEVKLLDHYMSTASDQRGQVTSMPQLNEKGMSRGYTTGYDTSSVNGTVYQYHYISFKAKYGADTSDLWPCDVFAPATRTSANTHGGWSGKEAFVSAWNGEHHVQYSQTHDNQTIKGNYNQLDYPLLWDYDRFGDSDTVAYLCFWENGANIGWSVPELYVYNIWVQKADGSGDYELRRSYNTVDDSDVNNQTAPAESGFTYAYRDGYAIANPDTTLYKEAYKVDFYYDRLKYDLTFINGSNIVKAESVYYEAPLDGYTAVSNSLAYHDPQQAGYYRFDGWYTTPDAIPGTEFALTGAKMPDYPVTLYACWKLISYDVSVYPTEQDAAAETNRIGEPIRVTYNTLVPEGSRPDESKLVFPDDPDAEFIGWFYVDENGQEQAFSFGTMTVTGDMKVYAKWRSSMMRQVTVRYVVIEEDGSRTQVADTETLMLRVGATRTFAAKTGRSLYEDYRTGCFPVTATHSVTATAEDEAIEYEFIYKQYAAVPYRVEYMVELADGTLRPAYKNVDGKAEFVSESEYGSNKDFEVYSEEHNDNSKAVVLELYIPENLNTPAWTLPEDYLPNTLRIQKVIVPGEDNAYNEDNTITFIYRYAPGESLYTVNHYVPNAEEASGYELYSFAEHSGKVGDTVTESAITIPGYTFSSQLTQEKLMQGVTLSENVLAGAIRADDALELNFYYDVNSYPYQVMYLEKDTNRVLLEAKTKDADGNLLTGKYDTEVSYTLGTEAENALLEDYDVDAPAKSIRIRMEAGSAASVNTIVFYYTRKNADLVITKTVALDPEQAAEEGISALPESVNEQEFTFTVYCPTGFHKSVYDYTLTQNGESTEHTVVVGATSMTLTLKNGQTASVHGLAMGEYTVTETYVPGFRTTVEGEITQFCVRELKQANQKAEAEFVNTFPFYTGDLVLKKNFIKHDETDPDASAPFKVRVTLSPDDAAREVDRVITWTEADGSKKTFTVPALGENGGTKVFVLEVTVPANGETKLEGVPVGTFKTEELVSGNIGYITDYYKVSYNKALHKNDEVSGTYDPANGLAGEIHGGHPTAVVFTNTSRKGTLSVNKTVVLEYAGDDWEKDTFVFTVQGVTELPDGVYPVAVNGQTQSVTVAGGKLSLSGTIALEKPEETAESAWSGSIVYENLPAGWYTMTETASEGGLERYLTTGPSGQLLVNDIAMPTQASFTNTYKRTAGGLKVGKEIVIVTDGSVIDEEQAFTFEVRLSDETLTGSYACSIKSADNDAVISEGTLSADANGVLTFALKHKQYIQIEGLPAGEYLVRELAVEGYDSSFGDVAMGNYSQTQVKVTNGKVAELNCQNAFPVYKANLIVEKKVVTPQDYSAYDRAPADDVFTFAVSIRDYSDKVDLSGGIAAKFYDSPTDETADERALMLSGDTLTFTLNAGQRVDLNLPACTYTIVETGMSSTVNTVGTLTDHYEVTYTVAGNAGEAGASYSLISGEVQQAVFTNTYKRHYADLTITTECADAKQSFVFDVTASDTALGDVRLQVVLVGTDAQTIRDLPVGTYTVTEQDKWSWRENGVASQTVELKDGNETVPFAFGVIDRILWLSGLDDLLKGGR